MEHLGDITKLSGAKLPPVDIITGGSPCQDLSVAGKRAGLAGERSGLFMEQIRVIKEMREATNGKQPRFMVWENVCFGGNTLITTDTGLKRISDIDIHDKVRTVDGSYQSVLKVHKTSSQETVVVKYHGGEITCTPNHPFLSENMEYKPIRAFMPGERVGFKLGGGGSKSVGMPIAYAIGRWLADGSAVLRENRTTKHRIFISTGYKKYKALKKELSKLPYRINENKMSWAVNFTFTSDEFGEFTDMAGYGAENKEVPAFVYDLVDAEKAEVLRGYLEGDGYLRKREEMLEWNYTTTSEKLAYGIARLARDVYKVGVSISSRKSARTATICGRKVNAKDYWVCYFTISNGKRKAWNAAICKDGFLWCLIKEIREGERKDVYNLTVDGSHTYEANGVCVHNCGAFSSNGGEDFRAVLEETARIADKNAVIPGPPKGKWTPAGCVMADGWSIAWRVHDAQFWGVPQRRRRIALVCDFGGGSAPEILFEREGVPGNPPPRGEEGEGTAAGTKRSVAATITASYGTKWNGNAGAYNGGNFVIEADAGECLNPWDAQTERIYGVDGPMATLPANGGKSGMNRQAVFDVRISSDDTRNWRAHCYETDISRSLDTGGENPDSNHGGVAVVCLNDQGGSVMDVSEDVSGTLRAQEHGHQPCVCFEPGIASRDGGHVYDGVAGTLRAEPGDNRQAVCYSIGGYSSEGMLSENPKAGIYEADTARTLDSQGGNPACNQGGMAVVAFAQNQRDEVRDLGDKSASLAAEPGVHQQTYVLEGNGTRPSHKRDGYAESETLNSTEHHAVCCIPINTMVGTRTTDENRTALGVGNEGDPQFTLSAAHNHAVCCSGFSGGQSDKAGSIGYAEDVCPTLRGGEGGNQKPCVCVYDARGNGDGYIVPTMTSDHENRITDYTALCVGNGQANQSVDAVVGALNTMHDQQAVMVAAVDCRNLNEHQEVSGTLQCKQNGGYSLNYQNPIRVQCEVAHTLKAKANCDFRADSETYPVQNNVVRRLTPLECERLQGFPVVRKVMFTEMTKDEYIAWNINEGNIVVDTEYGKVFATRGPGGIKLDEPRELTGTILNGYRVVSIRNGETKMQCRVHRIVWIAEHGIIPDGYVIDHINNDKQDNRLCNLQLLTAAENSTKARGDGLYKIHNDAGQAKITDEVHDFIQYVYGNSDLSIRQLSEIFGISKSRVHQIIHDEPWTDIGDWVDSKGKKHKGDADSPRYKALGNSIALPFWEWMAERMATVLGEGDLTMGSLFDGIGGFPLAFSRAGVRPVWASEIEEFCIAVTARRFGHEADGSMTAFKEEDE